MTRRHCRAARGQYTTPVDTNFVDVATLSTNPRWLAGWNLAHGRNYCVVANLSWRARTVGKITAAHIRQAYATDTHFARVNPGTYARRNRGATKSWLTRSPRTHKAGATRTVGVSRATWLIDTRTTGANLRCSTSTTGVRRTTGRCHAALALANGAHRTRTIGKSCATDVGLTTSRSAALSDGTKSLRRQRTAYRKLALAGIAHKVGATHTIRILRTTWRIETLSPRTDSPRWTSAPRKLGRTRWGKTAAQTATCARNQCGVATGFANRAKAIGILGGTGRLITTVKTQVTDVGSAISIGIHFVGATSFGTSP